MINNIILIVTINKFRVEDFLKAIRPDLNLCQITSKDLFVKNDVGNNPLTDIIFFLKAEPIYDINVQRLLVNIQFQGYPFKIENQQIPQYAENV